MTFFSFRFNHNRNFTSLPTVQIYDYYHRTFFDNIKDYNIYAHIHSKIQFLGYAKTIQVKLNIAQTIKVWVYLMIIIFHLLHQSVIFSQVIVSERSERVRSTCNYKIFYPGIVKNITKRDMHFASWKLKVLNKVCSPSYYSNIIS